MIGGLFYVGVRGARRETAGLRGLTGMGELTRANTRVIAEAQTWSLLGPGVPRGYSEHTQWLIDREVATLLTRAEARARELLTEHMQALHQLTTALVERETITGDQVRALVQAASSAAASADRKISPNSPSS